MKKINILSAAALLMLAACAQIEEPQAQDQEILFRLEGSASEMTKISIGDKNEMNIYPALWEKGDALSIFSADGKLINAKAELDAASEHQNRGSFSIKSSGTLPAAGNALTIIYPYSSNAGLNADVLETVLMTKQFQIQANDSRHIGKNTIAWGTSTFQDAQSPVNFTLTHLPAIVKISVASTELKEWKLKSVMLYARNNSTPLSGKIKADTAKGTFEVSAGENYAEVEVEKPSALSEKAQEIWMTTLPADFTAKKLYIVFTMTNAEGHTLTIPKEIGGNTLKGGQINSMSFKNLKKADNSCAWYEPLETRYIADYGEGWSYGPANCFVGYFDNPGIHIDVKARGNFRKCVEPAYLQVMYACEHNSNNKNNLIFNGVNGYDGSSYVKISLKNNFEVDVQIKKAGNYAGYNSKVLLLDKNSRPIWAFNFWGNKNQLVEQQYNNGLILDRNIGCDYRDGYYVMGSYYQWGRPFSFTWSDSMMKKTKSNVTDLSVSTTYPDTFFYTKGAPASSGDWYLGASNKREERIDDLWGNPNEGNDKINPSDGVKSIFDPCPKGYKVISATILAEINGEKNFLSGKEFKVLEKTLADGTKSYWPFSGCRWGTDGGKPSNNKNDIFACWSSSPVGDYSNNSSVSMVFFRTKDNIYKNSGTRNHGYPVRCMKDTDNR